MRDLVQALERAAPGEGMQPTAIPFAHVNHRSTARRATTHVLQPSVWIYVAGQKRACAGREARDLSEGDVLVISRPTTVVSEIVRRRLHELTAPRCGPRRRMPDRRSSTDIA
jgi:hypothetical protein